MSQMQKQLNEQISQLKAKWILMILLNQKNKEPPEPF
jgi:hypothetical protein